MGPQLTLMGLMAMYPTQDAFRRELFEQSWREGIRCPRCAHALASCLRGRGLREGAGCGYKASLTTDTLLHKTSTDLHTWLLAIWLLRGKITHAVRRGKRERAAQRKTLVAVSAEQMPEGGLGRAHLQSYLNEFCSRLSRRDARFDLFRRSLDRRVLYTPPPTYSQPIAA